MTIKSVSMKSSLTDPTGNVVSFNAHAHVHYIAVNDVACPIRQSSSI